MKNLGKVILAVTAVLFLIGVTGCGMAGEKSVSDKPLLKIAERDGGYEFLEGSEKVMFYQRDVKSADGKFPRNNYVHPLYGLDGEVLTEDFPKDHLWHRGVFWAWHQIYVGDKRVSDGWMCENISWDVYKAAFLNTGPESIALKVKVDWKSPKWTDEKGEQKPFIKETSVITVHRAKGDIRMIDFEIGLLAMEKGVRIGGSEDPKGYSGFSIRLPLPDDMVFTGEKGEVEPTVLAIEAGPWMDISGTLAEGLPVRGVAILCHKTSPQYPEKWILRRKTSMQNAAYPGGGTVEIPCDKPLVLRYRLVVHRGDAGNLNLEKLQAEYNKKTDFVLN